MLMNEPYTAFLYWLRSMMLLFGHEVVRIPLCKTLTVLTDLAKSNVWTSLLCVFIFASWMSIYWSEYIFNFRQCVLVRTQTFTWIFGFIKSNLSSGCPANKHATVPWINLYGILFYIFKMNERSPTKHGFVLSCPYYLKARYHVHCD